MSRPTTPEQRANRARITARGPRMPGAEPVASVPAARRRVEDWADEIGAVVAALRAAPAPEGETPNVSMDVLNGVTVAGARAFWALKDLETRHERLRVAVMSAVSVAELGHPNPTWAAIRADLAAAFNGICGDGPWGIHRFQPMREECKICAPESLLIASSVEVHCPHCGEGQPAPDGSLVWTPEELERGAGRCRCCACEQDIAIVHGKAKVE
jgi:hypothetical protein